ncbi:MAG: hypothetical protein NTX72_00470 [Candidatus Uhrbacteria bacterium]|nr:hypothetical protein [Candidatus Uhrbacteria bacterium]
MKTKSLKSLVFGPDTSLEGLWRQWMELNGLKTIPQAQEVLRKNGVGFKNLTDWLENKPTNDLLTSQKQRIEALTGIDIDGWMVCDAKQKLLLNHPELSAFISYDQLVHRSDIVLELNILREAYDNDLYTALAFKISPSVFCRWTIEGASARLPSQEFLPAILKGLCGGLKPVTCLEDLIFDMMIRAIFGCEPEELFPDIPSFTHVPAWFLKTFPGNTDTRISEKTGLHKQIVYTLLKRWNPKGKDKRFTVATMEKILRVIVCERVPALKKAFDENLRHYRDTEESGIWSVSHPLKVQIKPAVPQIVKTEDPAPKLAKATPPKRSHAKKPPPILEVVRETRINQPVVPVTEHVEEPTEKPEGPPSMEALLDAQIEIAQFTLDRLLRLKGQPSNPNVHDLSGLVLKHLSRETFNPRPGEKLTTQELDQLTKAVMVLRGALTLVCELDHRYLKQIVGPKIGNELFELLISHQGMKDLWPSDGACQVTEGMRESAKINSHLKGVQRT